MPVISTRRYSSYLSTPSTSSSSSSGIGSYRSTNYTSSSTSSTLPSSTSRYNYGSTSGGDTSSSYRTSSSTYRPSLSSGSTSTYRSSRYDFDDTSSISKRATDSLSTRIGVSKNNSSRYTSDTLPPLPPSSSTITNSSYVSKRASSRMRDDPPASSDTNGCSGKLSLMDDQEFYEKYSPSRYQTKFEMARSRSHSEAALTTPSRDSSSPAPLNVISSTHTPKSEVITSLSRKKIVP